MTVEFWIGFFMAAIPFVVGVFIGRWIERQEVKRRADASEP